MMKFFARSLITATCFLAVAVPTYAIEITGRGFGHGVGMSQWGAYGYAKTGFNYKQILARYYKGTELGKLSQSQSRVKVLLQTGSRVTFSSADKVEDENIGGGTKYVARRSGSRVIVNEAGGKRIGAWDKTVTVSGGPIKLYGLAQNGRRDGRYRGSLLLTPHSGTLYVVNSVDIEEYLRGVVPVESYPEWPQDALKAQAVAARSYAVATRKSGLFDQYADTRSQVYAGILGETSSTDRAVKNSAGEVLKYKGKVAATYFFDTSGGRTENIEDAWPGAEPQPYLKGVDDPYDKYSPEHRWGPISYTKASLGAKLASYVKGKFRKLEVVSRNAGSRVKKAKVVGSSGSTTVSGSAIQSALGLKSTWFYVK